MRTFDLDPFWPFPQSPDGDGGDNAAALKRAYPGSGSAARVPLLWDDAVREMAKPQVRSAPVDGGHRASGRMQRASIFLRHNGIAFFSSFDPKAALWLSMGFVAGMISWHAVGFWGFVSQAVLNGGDHSVEIASTPAPPAARVSPTATSPIVTGSLAPFAAPTGACMALAMNRSNGATSATKCSGDAEPFRDAGRGRRTDRLLSVDDRLQDKTAWTAATAVDQMAPGERLPPPAPSDFDLTISPVR